MQALGYSRFQKWAECPFAYSKRYLEDNDELPSAPGDLGKLVHNILEWIVSNNVQDWNIIEERIAQHDQLSDQDYHDVENMVFFWNKNRPAFNSGTVVEKKIAIKIENGEFKPAPWDSSDIRGIIDMLQVDDNGATILDYKSGRGKSGIEQLELYAAMLFSYFKDEMFYHDYRITLKIWYLRYGIFEEKIINWQEALEIEKRFIKKTLAVNQAIKKGEFPAKPNSNCLYCTWLNSCPQKDLINQAIPFDSIIEVAQRKIQIDQYLQAHKKRIDSIIKAYLEDHDRIELPDGTVIQYRMKTKSTCTDINELHTVLNTAFNEGRIKNPSSDYLKLSPDTTKLKGKRIREAVPELESLIIQKPWYNEIKIIKPGQVEEESEEEEVA